jgi:hypothetical protein
MVATYDDANLIVQLVRWGTEMGLEDAVQTLFAEGFEPASSSVDEPAVRKMLTFGEVLGTLVKQGVLDRGLVLDLWWASGSWARVKPSAENERERLGEPRLFENFEALAASPTS